MKLGEIKLQTPGGTVSLPVYEPADIGNSVYDVIHVQTSTGTGVIPFTDPSDAVYKYLRIYTENHGVLAAHDSASTSGIIDSFERENLSYYTGDTGSYSTVSYWSHEGSRSLEGYTGGSSYSIFSGSGLETYPERGDTIRLVIHVENYQESSWADPKAGFYFGGADSNNIYRASQVYWPDPETNSQGLYLNKISGGSGSGLASTSSTPTYDPGDVFSFEIEFGSSEIVLRSYTGTWDTLEAEISAQDSEHSGNMIGFLISGGGGGSNTVNFDNIHTQ